MAWLLEPSDAVTTITIQAWEDVFYCGYSDAGKDKLKAQTV